MKKHKALRVVAAVLICAGLIIPPVPVSACGPYFPEAIFSSPSHPDFPFDHFVAGNLGIVQPSYGRAYLYVAYRYFNELPLSRIEQKAALSLMNRRLWEEGTFPTPGAKADASEIWLAARKRVPGVSAVREINTFRRVQMNPGTGGTYYDSFVNCLDPAFVTAAKTLSQRIEQFGADSPATHEWVAAEDAVFDNCADKKGDQINIPAPADAGLPEIIRADRAYQIAAAHFYAEDFDVAGKLFAQIAQDPHSPWRATSALMVARSRIRAATLSTENRENVLPVLHQSEELLKKILADPSLAEVHDGAARLYGYVRYRSDPAGRTRELAAKLQKPGGADLEQNLDDYAQLLQKGPFQYSDGLSAQELSARFQTFSADVLTDDLTDWIYSLQNFAPNARVHVIERWRATKSRAWLISALIHTQGSDADAENILAASRKIELDSPANATVAFHRVRIEMEAGHRDVARSELDASLGRHQEKLPRSAVNLFFAARMLLARNLDELMRYSVRVPTAIGMDYGIPTPPSEPLLDRDGALAFTRALPTPLLVRAAEGKLLPQPIVTRVAESAWVRAVILGDEADALRLALDMAKLKPQNTHTPQVDLDVEPEIAAAMKEYVAAPDRPTRRFVAAVIILRMPGLRPYVPFGALRGDSVAEIDNYRDNWWCGMPDKPGGQMGDRQNPASQANQYRQTIDPRVDAPLQFLSANERQVAANEWTKLVAAGAGPSWLAEQTIAWAKLHREDSRVPEALYLTVRATRFGCEDKQTSGYSRAAFELLHSRYPKSEWTAKTPYWY